jgi:cytochrome b6-f complex iron-sulfur subunit
MNGPKSTRREFCAHAVSYVAIASLVESCGGSPTSSGGNSLPSLPVANGTVGIGNTLILAVDAGSPLATVGNAVLVQASAGNFLVARTGQDTFTALTAVCTHQVCTINGYQSGTFECPCHGSEYNTSGRVIRGPAVASLRQFSTQFSNNTLTISLV